MAIEKNSIDELLVVETVRLSGQIATYAAGSGVSAQTREILQRIDELLADAGTDRSEIILATIWLRDLATFAEMNTAWDEWMTTGRTPNRTTFENSKMPAGQDVRIEIVAARK